MPTTVDEIRSTTTIDAPIERVWKAITTPAEIKQWFFGVDTEADWLTGWPPGPPRRIPGQAIHRQG